MLPDRDRVLPLPPVCCYPACQVMATESTEEHGKFRTYLIIPRSPGGCARNASRRRCPACPYVEYSAARCARDYEIGSLCLHAFALMRKQGELGVCPSNHVATAAVFFRSIFPILFVTVCLLCSSKDRKSALEIPCASLRADYSDRLLARISHRAAVARDNRLKL